MPVVDSLSKLLAPDYPAEQITFVRNLFHALLALPLVLYRYGFGSILQNLTGLQCLRGLLFVGMTATYIFALKWMPLADTLAITFAFPCLIVLLSPWLLNEIPGIRRWLAVLFGFIGACLIIRPGFVELNPGVPWALGATACTAGYVLLTRKLSGTAPGLTMMLLPALIGSAALLGLMPFVWIAPTGKDLAIMVSIGLLAAATHYLIVLAYRYGEASEIAPLTYVQMVFAAALSYFLFGDLPDTWTTAGILLIVGSGAFIGWRERKAGGKFGA